MLDKDCFRMMYSKLMDCGSEIQPRGLRCIEMQNFHFELLPYVRFTNFEVRKLNIEYIKKEFLWYLKGDPKDTTICEHARMWFTFIREDGTINSNYGQYIFGNLNQFDVCRKILEDDKDSRRASIIILQPHHVKDLKSKDVPCTYSINFRIRQDELHMSVHMRSQDIIYGLSNDIPTFSFIHEMMYVALTKQYPSLKYGVYFHIVDSMHVYEKHYDMIKEMIKPDAKYEYVDCPKITSPDEVLFLRGCGKGLISLNKISIEDDLVIQKYPFFKWLTNYGVKLNV